MSWAGVTKRQTSACNRVSLHFFQSLNKFIRKIENNLHTTHFDLEAANDKNPKTNYIITDDEREK